MEYLESKQEEDPLADESLLYPVDAAQHDKLVEEIQGMVSRAADASIHGPSSERRKAMVLNNTDVLRVGFSSGPPDQFTPLKI